MTKNAPVLLEEASSSLPSKALLILGMHRSGTSVLTRLCNMMGAYLGEDLMAAAKNNNETGFWEHQKIWQLHERLLKTLGTSWDDTLALPDKWWEDASLAPFADELQQIIAEEFSGQPLWAIKDPRLSRVVPFWVSLLESMQVEPHFVLTVRHPNEVAMSLYRRDNFPAVKSLQIWLHYMLDAEYSTRGYKRVASLYDHILTHPEHSIEAVGQVLDIDWPVTYDEIASDVSLLIRTDLRHHHNLPDDTSLPEELRQWVDTVYNAFITLHKKGESEAVTKQLDAVRDEMTAYYAKAHALTSFWHDEALANRWRLEDEPFRLVALHQKEQQKKEARIEEAHAIIHEKEQLLQEKQEEVHAKSNEVQAKNHEIEQIHALHEQHLQQHLQQQHEEFSRISNDLKRQIEEQSEALLRMRNAYEGLTHAQHCTQQQVDAMRASSSWRLTAPLRACKTLLIIARALTYKTTYDRLYGLFRGQGFGKTIKDMWGFVKNKQGLHGLIGYVRNTSTKGHRYADWAARYDTLSDKDRGAIRRHIDAFEKKPCISIVMPVYNIEEKWLCQAIDSVRSQLYSNWELCIADDCSTMPHIKPILKEYAAKDDRIKIVLREKNGHISEASNSALELATGEFVALLDHDDTIPEHALYCVVEAINTKDDLDIIYSDEDTIDEHGNRHHPYFKSDWNPDLFFSQNMISHFGIYRRSLVNKVKGFRKGYEGSQDYDLALRVVGQTEGSRIHHIPRVLYHWRTLPGSTSVSIDSKSYAVDASRKAIKDFFKKHYPEAKVQEHTGGVVPHPEFHRIVWPLPENLPLVSLIIPTRDSVELMRVCVGSIIDRTSYPNYEIIIMNNQSSDPEALAYFKELEEQNIARVIDYDKPFNYSAINNLAVQHSQGELVGLINNDIEVINSSWLTEMVSHALRPDVGAVGAKLYYPNGIIQHAGVLTGIGAPKDPVAGHMFHGVQHAAPGYFGRAILAQTLSAVTAACLIIRKDIYEEVNGLEEEHLKVAFNDVDFCLKVRDAGYRNIWTPYAELYHHESATRGRDDISPEKKARFLQEISFMREKWGHTLDDDPYFNPNIAFPNPNIDPEHGDFALAFPSRAEIPWKAYL